MYIHSIMVVEVKLFSYYIKRCFGIHLAMAMSTNSEVLLLLYWNEVLEHSLVGQLQYHIKNLMFVCLFVCLFVWVHITYWSCTIHNCCSSLIGCMRTCMVKRNPIKEHMYNYVL